MRRIKGTKIKSLGGLTLSAAGFRRMADALQKKYGTDGDVVVEGCLVIRKQGRKVISRTLGVKIN